MMLLANSGKALQRSPSCQEFGFGVRFQAEVPAASDMIAEFANSIIIGTQIYGRLRNWMPAAADALPLEQTGKKCSTVLPDGPLHDLCPANQAKSKPTE